MSESCCDCSSHLQGYPLRLLRKGIDENEQDHRIIRSGRDLCFLGLEQEETITKDALEAGITSK